MLLLRIVQIGPAVVGWDPAFVVPPVSSDEIEAEVRDAQAYLVERAEFLRGQGLTARRRVIETMEPIARVIRDTAQREQVDAIALGTHGKGGMARMVLGSVSETRWKVLQSPCCWHDPRLRRRRARRRSSPP